jgi:surface antigen
MEGAVTRGSILRSRTAIALALALAATGCTTASKSAMPGLAFGALTGGSDRAATVKGSALITALNGGIISPEAGASLDKSSRTKALEAEYQALEYTPAGQAVAWKASGNAYRGEVVASQPYRVGSQDCRQYTHTVFADSNPLVGRGTACRNADGSWTPLA